MTGISGPSGQITRIQHIWNTWYIWHTWISSNYEVNEAKCSYVSKLNNGQLMRTDKKTDGQSDTDRQKNKKTPLQGEPDRRTDGRTDRETIKGVNGVGFLEHT
jgi:hypothetical protein